MPATAPNGSKRLTLTFPALNAARHVIFLVLGADKRDALRRIRGGEQLPAGARRAGPRRRHLDRRRRRLRRVTARALAGRILRRRCAR